MAEVARVVVRLLQRTQDERWECLSTTPGLLRRSRRRARSPPPRRVAASAGLMLSVRGAGGVGTSRSASLASRCSTDCGSGGSWTRYRDGLLRAGEERRHPLVREDHQLLDQRVRGRLRLEPRALDPALPVEGEVDLRALDSERAAPEPAPPEVGGDAVGQPDVVGQLVLLGALEDPLHLAVREPLAAADHGPVEARLAAGRDLDRDAEPVLVRPERAGVVGELVREHRRDEARARRPSSRARTPRGRAASRPGRSTRHRRCAPRSARRRARGGPRSRRRSPSPCPGRP